jgi:hypothetical protein
MALFNKFSREIRLAEKASAERVVTQKACGLPPQP